MTSEVKQNVNRKISENFGFLFKDALFQKWEQDVGDFVGIVDGGRRRNRDEKEGGCEEYRNEIDSEDCQSCLSAVDD